MFNFLKRLADPEKKSSIVDFKSLQSETFFSGISKENIKPIDVEFSELSQYVRRSISSIQRISRGFQIDLNNGVGANSILNFYYSLPTFNVVSPLSNQNDFQQIFFGKIHGYVTPQINNVLFPPDIQLQAEQFSVDSLNQPTNIGCSLFNYRSGLYDLLPQFNYPFPCYNSNNGPIVVEPKKILTGKLIASSINQGAVTQMGIRVFLDGYLLNSSKIT